MTDTRPGVTRWTHKHPVIEVAPPLPELGVHRMVRPEGADKWLIVLDSTLRHLYAPIPKPKKEEINE